MLLFFRYLWKSQEKKRNCSCPRRPKIIERKSNISFYFHTSLWCLKKVLWRPYEGQKALIKPFELPKRSVKIKKLCHFAPCIWDWNKKGQDFFFVPPTCTIFISLIIEIHKNRTWSMKTKLVCYKLSTLIYFQNIFHYYSITKCS